MPSGPIYPLILTEANWKSKKSTLLKLAGETGIGEAMRKAKAAFDKVKWDDVRVQLAARKAHNFHTVNLAEAMHGEYKAARGNLVTFYKAMTELEIAATKALEKFKKNPLIPSAATKHVADVAKQAKEQRLNSTPTLVDNSWAMYLRSLRAELAEANNWIEEIGEACDEIAAFAAAVKGAPTVATYNTHPTRAEARSVHANLLEALQDLEIFDSRPQTQGKIRLGSPRPVTRNLALINKVQPNDASQDDLLKDVQALERVLKSIRDYVKP